MSRVLDIWIIAEEKQKEDFEGFLGVLLLGFASGPHRPPLFGNILEAASPWYSSRARRIKKLHPTSYQHGGE